MTTPPGSGPPPRPAPGSDAGAGSPVAPDALARPAPPATPGEEPPLLDAERIPSRAPERAPRRAVPIAWAVAIAADAIQWVIWPLFAAGAATPVDAIVDVAVAAVLVRLLGWHWAFLPTFIVELLPGVDLVPTWTAAVFLATRGRRRA